MKYVYAAIVFFTRMYYTYVAVNGQDNPGRGGGDQWINRLQAGSEGLGSERVRRESGFPSPGGGGGKSPHA